MDSESFQDSLMEFIKKNHQNFIKEGIQTRHRSNVIFKTEHIKRYVVLFTI